MATPKSEKKKKGAPARKLARSKPKKTIKAKVKRRMIKKPVRPMAKKMQAPPPKDGNEAIRSLLLEMREKLLSGIAENRVPETLTTPSEIGDLVDQAGEERDRELSLLLTGREKEKLLAINEALEKLTEGTYGICEECGEKIGPGRLKVMPLAKFCVNCQSGLEKETSLQKKVEEEMAYRGLAFSGGPEEEET